MDDSGLTPEEHRRLTDALTAKNPRPYRSTRWPQAERLQHDVGGEEMVGALIGWRAFNAMPVMCVANDNYDGSPDSSAVEAGDDVREPLIFDNLVDHDTADRTVALHAAGKEWRPEEERFTRPRRNDPEKSMPAGMYTFNGAAYYQAESDAEDEANRAIDCTSARRRLGHICCRLLDLASGDSTTDEIATAVKQPGNPRAPIWVDWAIIRWMRDDSYAVYCAA